MAYTRVELDPARLLTAIHNNLNQRLFEAQRSDAKRLYNELGRGQQVPFLEINGGDHGQIFARLALDHSVFVGRLTFGLFRQALAAHLARVADRLRSGEDLNVYSNAESGDFVFHIPGLLDAGGAVNILVTAVSQTGPGAITVTLTFLDPAGFEKAE